MQVLGLSKASAGSVNTTAACISACCALGQACQVWQFCDEDCAALNPLIKDTCWLGGAASSIIKDETTSKWQGGAYSPDNQLFRTINCKSVGGSMKSCTLKSMHWDLCVQARADAPKDFQPEVPLR